MKLLIDECLSPDLVTVAVSKGHPGKALMWSGWVWKDWGTQTSHCSEGIGRSLPETASTFAVTLTDLAPKGSMRTCRWMQADLYQRTCRDGAELKSELRGEPLNGVIEVFSG